MLAYADTKKRHKSKLPWKTDLLSATVMSCTVSCTDVDDETTIAVVDIVMMTMAMVVAVAAMVVAAVVVVIVTTMEEKARARAER